MHHDFEVEQTEIEQEYGPVVEVQPAFYATCSCAWTGPARRTPDAAYDDGTNHQQEKDR